MKALVIGAGGFVGGYLISELSERGFEVCATKLPHEKINIFGEKTAVFNTAELDILDEEAVLKLLSSEKPDYIFHLAAQSSVALSWKKPALTDSPKKRSSLIAPRAPLGSIMKRPKS